MKVISIDKAGAQIAVKLGEDARVDPDKLMDYLSRNEGASFSPSGILRVDISDDGPITAAINVLTEVRA